MAPSSYLFLVHSRFARRKHRRWSRRSTTPFSSFTRRQCSSELDWRRYIHSRTPLAAHTHTTPHHTTPHTHTHTHTYTHTQTHTHTHTQTNKQTHHTTQTHTHTCCLFAQTHLHLLGCCHMIYTCRRSTRIHCMRRSESRRRYCVV
jgi:hypothetical protein